MARFRREKINLNKVSGYAIFTNSVQILAAVLVVGLALIRGDSAFSGRVEQAVLIAMAIAVIWGAMLDIREAFTARRLGEESDMLQDAYEQLSELNGTLRAQRHDFMNHLQVVYSLMEMKEYAEAQDYIEKVYGDIQKVGRSLKTAIAAVNALLASKMAECEEKHIALEMDIRSAWQDLPVPDWEMCRVLGNLIDNAIDALKDTPAPVIRVTTGESVIAYTLRVANNGPAIPATLFERIFQQGFTTKGNGHGMGLSIVRDILQEHGGRLEVTSTEEETAFSATIPKNGLHPAEVSP